MSIDISKLSAKELFELAQKKEQEETQAAEYQARVEELKGKRENMISEHRNVLLLTDKKIRDMQAQRDGLITNHELALAALDKEIEALGGAAPKAELEPKPEPEPEDTTEAELNTAALPVADLKPKAKDVSSSEDSAKLKGVIRQIMNKRPYISASLLKEKLASYGVHLGNFNQDLELWVRNGWLEAKGKGNYALGKRI